MFAKIMSLSSAQIYSEESIQIDQAVNKMLIYTSEGYVFSTNELYVRVYFDIGVYFQTI